jgi:hypothetical protein
MDTIALGPRLRHAGCLLGRTPLMPIDGEMVPAVSGETFPVYNPATGGVIANVPQGGKADVDVAVAAARGAFDERRGARVSPIPPCPRSAAYRRTSTRSPTCTGAFTNAALRRQVITVAVTACIDFTCGLLQGRLEVDCGLIGGAHEAHEVTCLEAS